MRKNLLCLGMVLVIGFFIISGWGMLIWQARQSAAVTVPNGDLIRLHVLANSDHPEDQELKLKVRDAVIAYLAPFLSKAGSAVEAREMINARKHEIIATAQEVVRNNGAAYNVDLQEGIFEFPVKAYGDLVLPAGKYEAVRILLGEAQGKNWWCVLFPPLCFIDAANATAVPGVAKIDNEKKADSAKVELRWKFVEWLNN
ncbi:stage II sporulation protein R [Anaerospora sp.]|jgi:stage II sporulation protein R|uniref:stage II sporulation protein R n=1 Tax=Anaerospora sp. TaxID=1960278 RepID=UPI002899841E|nr:stage II sporulation protein R [Anaerospora sp.]MDF2929189.1 stage sporulation protein [Anaerospora sp.]